MNSNFTDVSILKKNIYLYLAIIYYHGSLENDTYKFYYLSGDKFLSLCKWLSFSLNSKFKCSIWVILFLFCSEDFLRSATNVY